MNKSRSGFTMIEVLIVIALTIGLSVAGFTGFSTFRKSQTLKLGVRELAATLSATRQRAVAQENGTSWGVRLTSGSSTDAHTYKVFSGSSFLNATTTQSYVLGRGAKFSNPQASSTMDIVFAGATGFPSTTQVISLINGFTDGAVGDVIVKSLGLVSTRVDSGLSGYWHFDEGTSTIAYDSSGYSNVGTLTNSPTVVSSCRAGKCLDFNGTTNYVHYGNVLNMGLNDWTISLWIKTTSSNNQFAISKSLANNQNYRYAIGTNTGKAKLFMQGNGGADINFNGGITINDGLWHQLVFVYDRDANASIYVDGVFDTAQSIASWVSANMVSTNPFRVGSYTAGDNVTASSFFTGSIDEVKIYNRALSASEILASYNDLK